MKKLGILTVLCLFAFTASFGQGLKIRYDFNTDQFTFFRTKPGKPDKELVYPVVRQKGMIELEVYNMNKFVYSANCKFTSSSKDDNSDVNFMNLIAPIVIPTSTSGFFNSHGGAVSAEGVRGGLLAKRSAKEALAEVENSYKLLSTLGSNISNFDYAIGKLNDLRNNPYLPTDSIVAQSDRIMELIFASGGQTTADFSSMVIAFNKKYTESTSSMSTASSRFLALYNSYEAKMNGEDFEGSGLDDIVMQMNKEMQAFMDVISPKELTEKINALETLYSSIKSTSFTFNTSHMAKDDEVTLVFNFYENPKDTDGNYKTASLNTLEALTKVRTKDILITVTGDLKINSSFGFGFPYFKENVNYLNKDSVIVSQPGDNYSPNLAAYINFYRYTGSNVNVGGSIGVGIPITDRNRNFNIFLGLNTLFGQENRIGIHAGATIGQVKSLDQGYIVGEKLLSPTQEVPTRNVWEVGGFVGVSFAFKSGNSQ
jgi:muramidase (phage lysozyme)